LTLSEEHEMKARLVRFLAALLVIGAASVWLSPVAVASPVMHVAIHETIDFNTDPVTATFTATAPLCPAGSFVDTVERADGQGQVVKLVISSVYTCSDGSGTFRLLKRLTLRFVDPDSSIATGTFVVRGGTGAYAGLRGRGTDHGIAESGQGVGILIGTVRFH
jgi:hypothetical protein